MYHFTNMHGYFFNLNEANWKRMFHLAKDYGWEIHGTVAVAAALSPHEKWDGNYFDRIGAFVTPHDAKKLAIAIRNAMEDIPDKAQIEGLNIYNAYPDDIDKFNFIEWYSGPNKQVLRDFSTFCEMGGFFIK